MQTKEIMHIAGMSIINAIRTLFTYVFPEAPNVGLIILGVAFLFFVYYFFVSKFFQAAKIAFVVFATLTVVALFMHHAIKLLRVMF